MTENFNVDVSGYELPQKSKPLPKTHDGKEYEKWKDQSNIILSEQDLPYRVVDSRAYSFLIVFFVLATIILLVYGGIFLYQISDGGFKSAVSNSNIVNPLFNATVNSETENKFDNLFENKFNITININKIDVTC